MAIQEDRTGTWHAYGKKVSSKANSEINSKSFGDQHKAPFPKSIPAVGDSCFSDHLAARLPEVAATIDEADFGVLNLEVDALKLATREAILRQDWSTARAHFAFVDSVLEAAETELHEAIGVSYLVNLFYGETSLDFAKARTFMPKRLAAALEIMERHYEELKQ